MVLLLFVLFFGALMQTCHGQTPTPCPSGYIMEGSTCVDLDECSYSSLVTYITFDGNPNDQITGLYPTYFDPSRTGFQTPGQACGPDFYFSQYQSYITYPQPVGRLGYSDFTISFWVKVYQPTSQSFAVVGNRDACSSSRDNGFWNFVVTPSSGTFTITLEMGDPFVGVYGLYTTSYSYGTSLFVTATRKFTGVNSLTTLYVNGNQVDSHTSQGTVSFSDTPGLQLGTGPCSNRQNGQYTALDDLRIYSTVVDPMALYQTVCTNRMKNTCGVATNQRLCNNNAGGYTCVCQKGYVLGSSGSCVDLNECASSSMVTNITFDSSNNDLVTNQAPNGQNDAFLYYTSYGYCSPNMVFPQAYAPVPDQYMSWPQAVGQLGSSDFTISFLLNVYLAPQDNRGFELLSNRAACSAVPAMWNFIMLPNDANTYNIVFEQASGSYVFRQQTPSPIKYGLPLLVATTRSGASTTLWINGVSVLTNNYPIKIQFADQPGLAFGKTACTTGPNGQYGPAYATILDDIRIYSTVVDPFLINATLCNSYLLTNNCGAGTTCQNTNGGYNCQRN